jgi:hypothetical protein
MQLTLLQTHTQAGKSVALIVKCLVISCIINLLYGPTVQKMCMCMHILVLRSREAWKIFKVNNLKHLQIFFFFVFNDLFVTVVPKYFVANVWDMRVEFNKEDTI